MTIKPHLSPMICSVVRAYDIVGVVVSLPKHIPTGKFSTGPANRILPMETHNPTARPPTLPNNTAYNNTNMKINVSGLSSSCTNKLQTID